MARDPEFAPLYEIFQLFIKQCLIEDRSLLWPDRQFWTLENVNELYTRPIENPIPGTDKKFEEKLEIQLQGGKRELWAILADIYFIYCLPSDTINFRTKQQYVIPAAQRAGLPVPADDSALWQAQRHGFTGTSQLYHSKFRQFLLLLRLSVNLKGQADRLLPFSSGFGA